MSKNADIKDRQTLVVVIRDSRAGVVVVCTTVRPSVITAHCDILQQCFGDLSLWDFLQLRLQRHGRVHGCRI